MAFNPLGIVAGQAIGTGVGGGISTVITPLLRDLVNEAWEKYQSMPVAVVLAANVVASGERSYAWGLSEAHKQGINDDRFQALVDFSDTAPDLARMYELLHRGLISDADFAEGARKQLIEPKWLGPLIALRERLLSPAEAANAWQQGYMDEADAEAEAALSGVSAERSALQREMAGLPPGAMDSLGMLRRAIIDEATFAQIVREGRTKTKYTAALLALKEQVLPATAWAELWLRGWVTEAEAKAGGALTGYGPEDVERLYQNRGRPATPRQMWLAIRRSDATEADFRTAIKQSNIRTEYTDWLWATRFTYPSLFQLNRLVTSGALTIARGKEILSNQGWEEQDMDALEAWWKAEIGPEESPLARKYRTAVINRAYKEYTEWSLDAAGATAVLTQLGETPATIGQVLNYWTLERELYRRELTPTQIRKAYKDGDFDVDEALTRLDAAGYTPEDAATLLGI